jgi:isopentenyl diphosphate isomerase/L-lactate dehydrogenase-like FMN-dependent dehydrogenase
LRENVAAFERWVLRPRMLVDVSTVTTATTVLGMETSMPVLVAPTAFQKLAHPEGETATARGAEAAGTIFCLSTAATATPADIARAAPAVTRWFQFYWPPDRSLARELVARAADAGFGAVVLTVDLPLVGRRERDLRTRFAIPEQVRVPVYDAWDARGGATGAELLDRLVDPALTWRDLEWLRSLTDLPLVIKGILTAEDAVLALEHGADAIVVSNHGGRQLDGVAASLDALPEVVEAAGDRCEVLLDGGVRRGIDALKALALGARAVLVGRPALWGLAADGADGVQRVLELLRAEVELGLTLLGCSAPDAVSRAHVTRAAA